MKAWARTYLRALAVVLIASAIFAGFATIADRLLSWARGGTMIVSYARLILVMLPLAAIGIALLIATVTAVKCVLLPGKMEAGEEQARQEKLRPDGLPYPPGGRGMCDACRKPFSKVYYMPSGERLCRACYLGREMPRAEPIGRPAATLDAMKGQEHERQSD
jgi:hypothetical protein